MSRATIGTCAAMLVAIAPLRAQSLINWELATDVMRSVSPSRPNSVFGAQTVGVGETALSVRASAPLLALGPVRLRYAAQFLPLIRVTGVERFQPLVTSVSAIYAIQGKGTAYGVGLVPLGLDLEARLGHRAHLGVGGGVGIARFSQPIPVAGSRQRQFTAEWGARLGVDLDRSRAVELGFRWKHTSNGFTAWENPGVDGRLLTLGVRWRRGDAP